jgi:hypothetical protein
MQGYLEGTQKSTARGNFVNRLTPTFALANRKFAELYKFFTSVFLFILCNFILYHLYILIRPVTSCYVWCNVLCILFK